MVYKTGGFGGRWRADSGNPDFFGHFGYQVPLDDYSLMHDMQPHACRDEQGVWFVLKKRVFQ